MKKHIVTCVDYSSTSDGKARVLKVCNTRKEAEAYVKADMEDYAKQHEDEGIEVNFSKMSITFDYDTSDGCEWNIEEVEIPV